MNGDDDEGLMTIAYDGSDGDDHVVMATAAMVRRGRRQFWCMIAEYSILMKLFQKCHKVHLVVKR